MIKDRKAQSATDLIIIVVVIFFIAFIGVIFSRVWNDIDTGIQSSGMDATSKAASTNAGSGIAHGFDIGIVCALGLALMGLFITTREIQTNPMYFFLNVFFIILALGFGAIMSNVFDATNTNDFAVTRAAMPATVFVMGHLLEFAILAAFMILIGLFAKNEGPS